MNSLFRRLYHEQEAQVLYLVAALLVCLLGMAALSIDIGFALHGQRELQASADAAATAGAADISNNDTAAGAVSFANQYSGLTSENNAIKDLSNVAMGKDSSGNAYPQVQCLTYLKNLGMMCGNAAGGNAMAVVETATSPTFFGKLLGINSIHLVARSLSSMKGGSPIPANIMILVDTTPSMNQQDTTGDCKSGSIPGFTGTPTKEDCAKWGVRTLMDQLSPCATGLASCGTVTNGNVQNAVDEVSILTFPGLANTSSQTADYSNCGAQGIQQYKYAPASPTTTPPYSTVIPLSSDYRTSDSGALNGGSSPLVKAVDWQDGAGCNTSKYGLQVPVVYDTEFSTAIDLEARSSKIVPNFEFRFSNFGFQLFAANARSAARAACSRRCNTRGRFPDDPPGLHHGLQTPPPETSPTNRFLSSPAGGGPSPGQRIRVGHRNGRFLACAPLPPAACTGSANQKGVRIRKRAGCGGNRATGARRAPPGRRHAAGSSLEDSLRRWLQGRTGCRNHRSPGPTRSAGRGSRCR